MSIENTLSERGSRYGVFKEHASITQRLKTEMVDSPNWTRLPADMKESLEMIQHKIGRILNGDPTYVDSWVDIEGYAHLVAQRLNDEAAKRSNAAAERNEPAMQNTATYFAPVDSVQPQPKDAFAEFDGAWQGRPEASYRVIPRVHNTYPTPDRFQP